MLSPARAAQAVWVIGSFLCGMLGCLATSSAGASCVALQGDGKIVVVQNVDGGQVVARYNADGALDSSFSGDGILESDLGRPRALAVQTAVAVQPDGKIVVVGRYDGQSGPAMGVERYDSAGSPDPTFSGDGRQTTSFSGSAEGISVALQSDGKIVVGGRSADANKFYTAIARFNADGSLDSSFSGDGLQETEFSGGAPSFAVDLAIQADGDPVAAVLGTGQFSPDFVLARYGTAGSLDTIFSTDFNGGEDSILGVAVRDGGRLVAAGSSSVPMVDDARFAVASYNADGSPDPTFSGDGKQTTDLPGSYASANDIAVQATDGKIVAAGYSLQALSRDMAVVRYGTDGSPDPSFSGDGAQTVDFGGDEIGNGVALQTDGKIVIAGPYSVLDGAFNVTSSGIAILRLNSDGSLDSTFSGDGKQTTYLAPRDQDGDGVPDANDSCPTESGPVSNDGCPESAPPDGHQGPTAACKAAEKKLHRAKAALKKARKTHKPAKIKRAKKKVKKAKAEVKAAC